MVAYNGDSENNNVRQRRSRCAGWVKGSQKYIRECCTVRTMKRRLPILAWIPTYNLTLFIQDIIAGVTVGLTAIPQGIAYAVVAGLSPEYGLYSGLMGGFVYLFFGSCKDVTVGPTAIMSVMVAKYVAGYNADFAVLAAFLTGIGVLLLGILNLGFLVDFISSPVISGFTTAAALQIAATQLKALFGLSGPSGNTFYEAVVNFVKNVKTAQIWDPVLGFITIIILILLKYLGKFSSRTDIAGFSKRKNLLWKLNWFTSLARNAVVVVIGIVVAYIIKVLKDKEPLTLTGTINGGIPRFQLPPFSSVVGNQTYSFTDMLSTFGPQSLVLPLISILESIAIAKAFARGKMLDATQEMIALGLCNIIASFGQSMPLSGSFTRTAINHASGVQTTAGGVFTCLLVLLALSLLTSTFYYIPKATLAGLIITAMFSMIDYTAVIQLWRNNKTELTVLLLTLISCLTIGLEYGVVVGVIADACVLLFRTARISVKVTPFKLGLREGVIIKPSFSVAYCAADHLSRIIQETAIDPNYYSGTTPLLIVIDGRSMETLDTTVAKNLVAVISDMEKKSHRVLFWNFPKAVQKMCEEVAPNSRGSFFIASNVEEFLSTKFQIPEVKTWPLSY